MMPDLHILVREKSNLVQYTHKFPIFNGENEEQKIDSLEKPLNTIS